MSSTEMPAALGAPAEETVTEGRPAISEWVETALTALFTAAAVLFVSVIAVVTGLL
jgi:hypothetical protein